MVVAVIAFIVVQCASIADDEDVENELHLQNGNELLEFEMGDVCDDAAFIAAQCTSNEDVEEDDESLGLQDGNELLEFEMEDPDELLEFEMDDAHALSESFSGQAEPELDTTDEQKQAQLESAVSAVGGKSMDNPLSKVSDKAVKVAADAKDEINGFAAKIKDSNIMQAGAGALGMVMKLKGMIEDFMNKALGQLKIMFGTLQIVTTFIGTFEVEWPEVFTNWSESLQVVNLGVFDVASVQCYNSGTDFYSKVTTQAVFPLVIGVLIFGVAKLRICTWALRYNRPIPHQRAMHIESQHMFAFLVSATNDCSISQISHNDRCCYSLFTRAFHRH